MTNIIQYMLIIMLIIQIFVLLHMLYANHKRYQQDKKIWEQMDIAIKDQINRYNKLYPDEPLKIEEDKSEQQIGDKK